MWEWGIWGLAQADPLVARQGKLDTPKGIKKKLLGDFAQQFTRDEGAELKQMGSCSAGLLTLFI